MNFISDWFKNKTVQSQKVTSIALLESKQTGSCGGMSTTELKIRIELILSGIKTKDSIMSSVTKLARLSHPIQSQFLTQLTEISEISMTHAYSMMLVYEPALNVMTAQQHEHWVEQIIHALSTNDLIKTNSLIKNYTDFSSQINTSITLLTNISEILQKLIFSITQNDLTLTSFDPITEAQPYTDGKTIFLPASISLFDNYHDNYLLYKIIAFHLLGQIECQTNFALKELEEGISEYGDEYLKCFSTLETLRINQYLKEKLPGMWKKILNIHALLNIDDYPEHIFHGDTETSVFDSLAWLKKNGVKEKIFDQLPYQTNFSVEKLSYLVAEEKLNKQPLLMNIYNQNNDKFQEMNTSQAPERIYFKHNSNSDIPISSNQSQNDVWQNLTEKVKLYQDKQLKLNNELKQTIYLYPEWDTSLNQYRTDWCRVEEIPIEQTFNDVKIFDDPELKFYESRIKRSLDLIINDQKLIRYQNDGDEVDIDAWVSAKSNKANNADDFQNLYIKNNKNNRSIAIMFAVDISGSTAGWKNKVIKQSTWLLSKTLAKLNDQYAIYAFSGSGREHCHIYPIKKFEERYNDHIKHRIASLEAQQYTRMGVAIRHLTKTLKQTDAKTKILFVLTDGKPDDIDSYRGHYGIEDTRHAFNEAKAQHINPFVLTFDQEAMDYLPHMLGKKHFRLISNIAMLPIQISTIYKQLTT